MTDFTSSQAPDVDIQPSYVLKDEKKKNDYDNTNLANVLFYHSLYILFCPFIALWEITSAAKSSLTRDFGWFSN